MNRNRQNRSRPSRSRQTRKEDPLLDRKINLAIERALSKNIEDKFTLTTQNGGIDYNGSIFDMTSALVRGDGAVDYFTGNLVRPKKLTIRWSINTNQTFNVMRFLIFQWLDASVPIPAGVINTTGSTLAPHAALFHSNIHKILVHHDSIHCMYPVAGSYAVKCGEITLSNFRTIQFATGSTNPQMGGIYMLAVSDDGAPGYPQLLFVSELVFSDA